VRVQVWLGKIEQGSYLEGRLVAIKVASSDEEGESVKNEGHCLLQLNHPGLVQTLGLMYPWYNVYALILEYFPCGSLMTLLTGPHLQPPGPSCESQWCAPPSAVPRLYAFQGCMAFPGISFDIWLEVLEQTIPNDAVIGSHDQTWLHCHRSRCKELILNLSG
jgi:serine/threonine protein kinase